MLSHNDIREDLRTAGMRGVSHKESHMLTLLLNKRLEKLLPPRINEARLREIVRDEMKKAGE